MFNITFWAVTQPFGQNNPFAEFVHIIRSTGLYLTQHFLECTVYCLDRIKNNGLCRSKFCLYFFSYYIIIHIFFSLQKNTMLCVKASVPHSCCGVYTSVNRCNLCLSPPHLSHCCSHPAVLQVSPLHSLSADRGPQQLVLFL